MPTHKMVTVSGIRYRLEDAPAGHRPAHPRAAVVPEPEPAGDPSPAADTAGKGKATSAKRGTGGRNRS